LVWPTANPGDGEGERVAVKEAGFGFGSGMVLCFDPLQVQWVEVIKKDSRFALFTQLATSSQEEDPHQERST
jgi:hypothetical protein